MKKSPQRLSDFHKGQILTEGLILVREDICDWITELIGGPPISGDSFLTTLQTGVVLCDLVRMIYDCVPPPRPPRWPPVAPWPQRKALRASFHARENISLFLNWCRAIGMKDTILFETRGLNDADEEKNIVLTLLHLGEICTDFDMPVPQFARFYKEMMTAKSTRLPLGRSTYALSTDTSDLGSMESGSISARSESNLFDSDLSNSWQLEAEDKVSRIPTAGGQRMAQKRTSTTAADIINGRMSGKSFDKLKSQGSARSQVQSVKETPQTNATRQTKFVKNNMKNIKNEATRKINEQKLTRSKSRDYLSTIDARDSAPPTDCSAGQIDLKIKEIVNRCKCHTKFTVERTTLQEGMYRIGSKNIFVRMFRGNVMLRVGGGWETLNEYLNKYDPCCKADGPAAPTPRRQSMIDSFTTDLTSDGIVGKNLRKLSQYELTTVKKKMNNIHSTALCK